MWFISGAQLGLAIALDMARRDAEKMTREGIQNLVEYINFLTQLRVPQGKRLRTIRVEATDDRGGLIEATACPYDLLLRYAAMSGLEKTPDQ